MTKKAFRQRFPAPWRVEEARDGYIVLASCGTPLAYVRGTALADAEGKVRILTFSEAKTLANAIAALQLMGEAGTFVSPVARRRNDPR